MSETDYDEGMAGKIVGNKLQWNEEGQWIRVDDLPTKLINEIKDLPCYAATMVVQEYLNDNGDGIVNECAV